MTKTYPLFIKSLIVFIYLLSSACAQATPTATTLPPSPTVKDVQFLDLSQVTPLVETVTASIEPTDEPTATNPPTATNTSIPVVIETLAESGCSNQAEFVKHLSISYNTAIKPGEYFTKIWQIRNIGTCIWDTSYRLVFIGGESMQAPEAIQLAHEVKPQETVDIRVTLVAPQTPAFYENSWMLQDQDGNFFGVGPENSEPLLVKIEVPVIFKPKPI